MNAPLHNTIQTLRCGAPLRWRELEIVPLFGSTCSLSFTTMERASFRGEVRITEVSESGRVPKLNVFNDGEQPLLILDSTELEGGKQNRMLNTSVLIPPHTEVQIPVSCIEAGRWHRRTRNFTYRSRSTPASMRARKSKRVSASLKMSGRYDAGQSEVWNEVEETLRHAHVSSETSSLTAALDRSERNIEEALRALQCQPQQIGMAAYLRGSLMGVDLIAQSTAFAEFYRQLLGGYVMDTVMGIPPRRVPVRECTIGMNPLPFLEAALRCPQERHASPGMGVGMRISGVDADTGLAVEAAALTLPEGVVHLAVHPSL